MPEHLWIRWICPQQMCHSDPDCWCWVMDLWWAIGLLYKALSLWLPFLYLSRQALWTKARWYLLLRIDVSDAVVYMQLETSGDSTLDAANVSLVTRGQCSAASKYSYISELCTSGVHLINLCGWYFNFCTECLSKCTSILELCNRNNFAFENIICYVFQL